MLPSSEAPLFPSSLSSRKVLRNWYIIKIQTSAVIAEVTCSRALNCLALAFPGVPWACFNHLIYAGYGWERQGVVCAHWTPWCLIYTFNKTTLLYIDMGFPPQKRGILYQHCSATDLVKHFLDRVCGPDIRAGDSSAIIVWGKTGGPGMVILEKTRGIQVPSAVNCWVMPAPRACGTSPCTGWVFCCVQPAWVSQSNDSGRAEVRKRL